MLIANLSNALISLKHNSAFHSVACKDSDIKFKYFYHIGCVYRLYDVVNGDNIVNIMPLADRKLSRI